MRFKSVRGFVVLVLDQDEFANVRLGDKELNLVLSPDDEGRVARELKTATTLAAKEDRILSRGTWSRKGKR